MGEETMSGMPEGAQLSPDGHYWWDGTQWQPVDAPSGGGQGHDAAAAFTFEEAAYLIVSDESQPEARAGRPTKVSFGRVWNTGTGAGTATVTIFVDGTQVQSWTSAAVQPQQSDMPADNYIHDCGAYSEGTHKFTAKVDPPAAGYLVELDSDVDIAPPPND
jgi:hypothetical protein